MYTSLMVPLVGLIYTLVFGLLPVMRREGFSGRFLVEAISLTIVGSVPGFVWGFNIHPLVFLLIIYVVTMRVRLLVDLGSALARRGRLTAAAKTFVLAATLWPDPAAALMVRVNQAACSLQQGLVEEAIPLFKTVIEDAVSAGLGIRYRCACHYNLGIAYSKKDMISQASAEFEEVMDLWPGSTFAKRAETAIEKLRGET